MSGLRWGIFAAIGAIIISLMLGMIVGNQALRTILTALVFGFIFFGFGIGLRVVISNYFPELLVIGEETDASDFLEEDRPEVSIAAVNTGEYAVPEMYKIPGESQELGNIQDLLSGVFMPSREGIDDKPEEVYNSTINQDSFSMLEDETPAPPAEPVFTKGFTPSLGEDEGLGGLPDLDMMAMAFSPASPSGHQSSSVPDVIDDFIPTVPVAAVQVNEGQDRSHYKGNKAQPLEGDFDPKEIAQGIRTVLNKDK